MHNKLVIADDVVVTGSFNLSNHAMGNAENVLLMRDAAIASKYEAYVRQLMTRYKDGTSAQVDGKSSGHEHGAP